MFPVRSNFHRFHGAVRDIPMPTFSTGTSFRVAAGKRTSLRGTFSGSLAPFYATGSFPISLLKQRASARNRSSIAFSRM